MTTCRFLSFSSLAALLPLVFAAFAVEGFSEDFLIVNRDSQDIVLHEGISNTCRYPKDLRRFGTPGPALKVFPVNADPPSLKHLLYSGIDGEPSPGAVFLERLENGSYAEGTFFQGNEVLAVANTPDDDGWFAILKTGGSAFLAGSVSLGNGGPMASLGPVGPRDFADAAVTPSRVILTAVSTDDRRKLHFRDHGRGPNLVPLGVVFEGEFLDARFADVNGDGEPDLVSVARNEVSVHLRSPGGGLQPAERRSFPFPSPDVEGRRLNTADFDGDGALDLLLQGQEILFGNGKGRFLRSRSTPLPRGIRWLGEAGDLDGDGFGDLVSASPGSLRVFLGGPGGELSETSPVRSGVENPLDIRLSDMDGDFGFLDVILAGYDAVLGSSISILKGKWDGRFEEPRAIPLGGFPIDAAAADLDGDGRPEVVVLQQNPPRIKVLGRLEFRLQFGAPRYLPAPMSPASLFAVDVDGDRLLDLAVNDRAGNLQILAGDGRGEFPSNREVPGAGSVLLLEDMSGDGVADLVRHDGRPGFIDVLRGTGREFLPAAVLTAGREPVHAAVFDADGDGRKDLFVANRLDSTVSYYRAAGEMEFEEPEVLLSGGGPSRAAFIDLAGDDRLDLITLNLWTSDVSIFEGLPEGGFQTEDRVAGPSDLREVAFRADGEPFLAFLGGGREYAISTLSRKSGVAGGGSDCGGFDNPGRDPVRLLIVNFDPFLFLRGDSNGDGVVDISDAVRILGWLFHGEKVNCLDSLDTDDSGQVDISDAISLLSFLFLGGAPPAPPRDAPGSDLKPDRLLPCG